ncbi:putative quinol monooxygenase [Cupriavidus pauculus]|uniref:ABM domain-containing protein n=1 Tax=Cupriavidus pauculus TaxID=82633 RepID=A0A2N5C6N6_9BURK|nr:antibiotic biosynthesis monooxygenase family protein [Cupriavidus pauculus]PLP97891.1 hypothetical protein CYJ10_24075 [Cupriavidus pauculus]
MERVVVIASIRPYAGHEREVVDALLKAVTFARLEPGCQRCELHRGRDDEQHSLVLVERWGTTEDWRKHQGSAASQALKADIAGIADLEVRRLQRLA